MNRIGKNFAVFFILIMAISSLSLIVIKPTSAQSISKPSVPEFTVKFVDNSNVVPSSTSIDPFTGKEITHPSYVVQNRTLDVTIKNQPFTPIKLQDGNVTVLFYIIRWKGHYENWTTFYDGDDYFNINSNDGSQYYGLQSSSSAFTAKAYSNFNFLEEGAIDFQVKAIIGFNFLYFGGHIQPIGTLFHYVEESGWSNTQTIIIGETSASASPNPTTTPSVPEFSWPTILSILFAIPIALAIVSKRLQRNV